MPCHCSPVCIHRGNQDHSNRKWLIPGNETQPHSVDDRSSTCLHRSDEMGAPTLCAPADQYENKHGLSTYERDIDLWTSRSCLDTKNSPALNTRKTYIELERIF